MATVGEIKMDRRKAYEMMTDAQHRDYIFQRMEKGDRQFTEIHKLLTKMSEQLEENTAVCKSTEAIALKTETLAIKTAGDTSGLVAVEAFFKAGTSALVTGAKAVDRGVDKGGRKLTKWALILTFAAAAWHGDIPSLKEIAALWR